VNTIGKLNTFQDSLVVASNVYESKRTYHKRSTRVSRAFESGPTIMEAVDKSNVIARKCRTRVCSVSRLREQEYYFPRSNNVYWSYDAIDATHKRQPAITRDHGWMEHTGI